MLLLELTDGTQTVFGMEYQLIPSLKVTTPPGTKVNYLLVDLICTVKQACHRLGNGQLISTCIVRWLLRVDLFAAMVCG